MKFKSCLKTSVIAGMLMSVLATGVGPANAYIPDENGSRLAITRSVQAVLPEPQARVYFQPTSMISNMHRATQIPTRVASLAPLGFQLFCIQNPDECRIDADRRLAYSPNLMQDLARINLHVNRAMEARYDDGADRWTVGGATGDCEDFVLTKRSQLVGAGIPAGALRIATALTRSGSGHAVLVVLTNRGDFVLDNMTNQIKPWDQTGLKMLSISGADPSKWYKIG